MSPFLPVRVRALENRLSVFAQAHSAYLASERFVERSELKGAECAAERLAVTHYLLQRLALAPNDLAQTERLLAQGCVCIQYFGVVNPVPMFFLPVGSPEHIKLTEAVVVNKDSRMFNAALRVLSHRGPKKVIARSRFEDAQLAKVRATLTWPTREDYAKDWSAAEKRYAQNVALLDACMRAVRALRQDRLARLARAATPGLTGWTELLEDIAVNVFCATVH